MLEELFDFLKTFWSNGFTHGDLTFRNLRYNKHRWCLIDVSNVTRKESVFPFTTPCEFYQHGYGHRDHNQFRIMIDITPEWKQLCN